MEKYVGLSCTNVSNVLFSKGQQNAYLTTKAEMAFKALALTCFIQPTINVSLSVLHFYTIFLKVQCMCAVCQEKKKTNLGISTLLGTQG